MKKKASKAWIAGVVIGIIGLLTVAGMGVYFWRRRQRNQSYGPETQGLAQGQIPAGYPLQQTAYNPQQQSYWNTQNSTHESKPSPSMQSMSPNMGTYDNQSHYGYETKPQEGIVYGNYDAHGGAASTPGIGTVQMPPGVAQVHPRMSESFHDLHELASSSGR